MLQRLPSSQQSRKNLHLQQDEQPNTDSGIVSDVDLPSSELTEGSKEASFNLQYV